MRTRPLAKALAALATTLAVLTLMATPASATVFNYPITQGDIVITTNGGPVIVWPLADLDPDPCGLGDNGTFDVDLVGTTTSATTEFVGFDLKTSFSILGQVYQVDLSLVPPGSGADNTGAHSGTASAGTGTQKLWLHATIYAVDPPECEKAEVVCDDVYLVWDDNVTGLGDLAETYTGPANAATSIFVTGDGLVFVTGECAAPLAGLLDGAEAEITDLP